MKMTLAEIAALVQGEAVGDPAAVLEGVAGLEDAGPRDLSFLANPKLEKLLETTRAGAVIVAPEMKDKVRGHRVLAKNPHLAFIAVLRAVERELTPKRPPGIHPTAVVGPYATIGKDAHVGAHAVVEDGAVVGERTRVMAQSYVGHQTKIGKDCVIYPGVVIRERCELGERVILHPGVVIGGDGYGFVQAEGRHHKVPQLGRVVIEDDVEIQAGACIARGALGDTKIGRGTKIDELVHIAHNVKLGEHCLVMGGAIFGGSIEVGNGATIGGQTTLPDHIKIGEKAILLGCSAPLADIPAGAVMVGMPARGHREFFRLTSYLNKLPELFETVKELRKAAGPGEQGVKEGSAQ